MSGVAKINKGKHVGVVLFVAFEKFEHEVPRNVVKAIFKIKVENWGEVVKRVLNRTNNGGATILSRERRATRSKKGVTNFFCPKTDSPSNFQKQFFDNNGPFFGFVKVAKNDKDTFLKECENVRREVRVNKVLEKFCKKGKERRWGGIG